MCVALTCGVQGGPQSICRTVYETKYTINFEQKCDTVVETICETTYDVVTEDKCEKFYETVYVDGESTLREKERCIKIPRELPKQVCREVPEESCTKVPFKTSTKVPKQECD